MSENPFAALAACPACGGPRFDTVKTLEYNHRAECMHLRVGILAELARSLPRNASPFDKRHSLDCGTFSGGRCDCY